METFPRAKPALLVEQTINYFCKKTSRSDFYDKISLKCAYVAFALVISPTGKIQSFISFVSIKALFQCTYKSCNYTE